MEAHRVARGWGSHIFRHSAHRWRQGCQPYAPAAFYPQRTSWNSFLLEAESTPGLEGLGKLKKSTSSGTRSGDLLACSIVPQQTTLPCAPAKRLLFVRYVDVPSYLLEFQLFPCNFGNVFFVRIKRCLAFLIPEMWCYLICNYGEHYLLRSDSV
jgi:hypothetical protein